jgi:hypothetical protein
MSTREQLSTTVNKKFYDVLRRHAYTMRLNQNDVLELYQQAYLRELEQKKAEKKIKKDN